MIHSYIQRFFKLILSLIAVLILGLVNWQLPLYRWLGDSNWVSFIWLGIFFVLLDIAIELIIKSVVELRLVGEALSFGRNLKKVSGGFKVLNKLFLPNNLKVDYVVIGSSGVWTISIIDRGGKIEFNGDELVQDGSVITGVVTKSLEKAYSLAGNLKEKLNRDFKVAPVVVFLSPKAYLKDIPSMIKGVYIISADKVVELVENTDIQLLDTHTIEEINKILR